MQTVVSGDLSVKDEYIRRARQLESEGVDAIISNCGFTSLLQDDVAAAVSIPVGLSSLMLVPFVARLLPPGRSLGLLTYDSTKLRESHFNAAGWSTSEIPVAIGGIEGSDSWREFAEPVPNISPEMLVNDVMAATSALLLANPTLSALVFECAGFPLATQTVRMQTGLAVADFVTLGRMLMDIAGADGRLGR
ncbi:hypothetical protein [Phyllobacterium endophyticum]|uniref:hypothetical protein n=1 Tax=Phyllobacterium endophyticum TaxID=1149773 RepID=UPI001AEE0628|nr:hypothetical protein [Phyllobacterium endophyticum]